MSTDNPGAGTPVATATPGSPIHVNVSVPESAPAPKKSAKADNSAQDSDKSAEKARNKGARSVLKGLGVPKEERDGLLKEIRETRSAKSLQEKLVSEHKARAEKAEAELRLLKDQAGTYEALAKTYADEQFAALSEAEQKFIAKQAGDSLQSRLKLIADMKESGLITKQVAAAETAKAKAEVQPAKPANTSNAVNPKAPPPAGSPTPKQLWRQMLDEAKGETDRGVRIARERMAAQFYAANQNSIDSDF